MHREACSHPRRITGTVITLYDIQSTCTIYEHRTKIFVQELFYFQNFSPGQQKPRCLCNGVLTADSQTRTDDLRITNALLYQLSHIGTWLCVFVRSANAVPIIYYTQGIKKINRKFENILQTADDARLNTHRSRPSRDYSTNDFTVSRTASSA